MGIPRDGFSRALKRAYDYLDRKPENGAAPEVTGLSVEEKGVGALKQTVFTLTNMPISVVSVSTGNGVGGTQIYDFPAGRILHLGTMAELSVSIATAKQADFTDATPEGDLGIGTLAPANADALGTDATDDNFGTAAAFTMSSYADPSVSLQSEPTTQFNGTGTAINLFLNALVDAADIDNDVTTEILVSGTITVHWINLGDVA
jgi:hypothetical protein